MEHSPLKLEKLEYYKKSALIAIKEQLEKHFSDLSLVSLDELESQVSKLNVYPNLKQLKDLSQDEIFVLDENNVDITDAEKAVLNGELFFEHACAGEATRLGLGTKYLINLKKLSIEKISELIDNKYSKEKILEMCGGDTKELFDMSLGTRHMMQLSFDISKLAKKHGEDVDEILKKQSLLIILNEFSAGDIIDDFIKHNFFGFNKEKVFFMVQLSFHGIHIENGELVYHEADNKRLHNHGQMYMQKTHDYSIFYLDENNEQVRLKSDEFENVLKNHKDLVSYNIEDISYLTNSIDYISLAKSLELGEKGYEMVMEIVSQNPDNPIKGGAAFYDPILAKNVMIESNRLLDLRNEEIKHLNKNFNHYPMPASSWKKVKEKGLHMCYAIKKASNNKAYLYPCPVQGDINFHVKTAFLMRKELKPIQSWKSSFTTPVIVKAMFKQERQEGFLEFAKDMLRLM